MALYEFEGKVPSVGAGSYVHPEATLIGDVEVGRSCFIGPGARLRGDWGGIRVGDGCNIQDNCVLHAQPGEGTRIGDRCHIAHGSILHGAVLEDGVFVGMGCMVMDGVVLKAGACLAAGTLITAGKTISADSLAMGWPGKESGRVPPELRAKLTWAWEQYLALPERYLQIE